MTFAYVGPGADVAVLAYSFVLLFWIGLPALFIYLAVKWLPRWLSQWINRHAEIDERARQRVRHEDGVPIVIRGDRKPRA